MTHLPQTTDWRALGARRLERAAAARSADDYRAATTGQQHPWTFEWGSCWTATVTYRVADYAAELGFFVDGLGFALNALGPDFCMFAAPDRSWFFCIVPATDEVPATPADAIHLGFMLADVAASAAEIERRGIAFTEPVAPWGDPPGPMLTGALHTPNGIRVELWGMTAPPG